MLQSFQQRYWLASMSALAVFICHIDRVNISVAIIPMPETHGWSPQTQGLVLSSFLTLPILTFAPLPLLGFQAIQRHRSPPHTAGIEPNRIGGVGHTL